jgi:hypothetical protein
VAESFSAGGMSAKILKAGHLGLEYEVGVSGLLGKTSKTLIRFRRVYT